MKIEWQEHEEGDYLNVMSFRDIFPNRRIIAIDDKVVYGFCESCGNPIFEGEEYGADDDGVAVCQNCME